MPKRKYTPEFKSKIVLAILQGDKEFLCVGMRVRGGGRKVGLKLTYIEKNVY